MATIQNKKERNNRITDELIADALEKNRGIVVLAARALGVHRVTISKHLSKNPELREIQESAAAALESDMVDVARNKLYSAVESGNMTAIIFLLKTRGGYEEKVAARVDDLRAACRPRSIAELVAIATGKPYDRAADRDRAETGG